MALCASSSTVVPTQLCETAATTTCGPRHHPGRTTTRVGPMVINRRSQNILENAETTTNVVWTGLKPPRNPKPILKRRLTTHARRTIPPKWDFFGWARAVVFQITNVPDSHSDNVPGGSVPGILPVYSGASPGREDRRGCSSSPRPRPQPASGRSTRGAEGQHVLPLRQGTCCLCAEAQAQRIVLGALENLHLPCRQDTSWWLGWGGWALSHRLSSTGSSRSWARGCPGRSASLKAVCGPRVRSHCRHK
jgi:hypothetical protein